MGIKTLSTSSKKEVVHVPDTNIIIEEENFDFESNHHVHTKQETDLMDEFDCISLDKIDDDDAENLGHHEGRDIYGQLNYWDSLMPSWDGFGNNEEPGDDYGYENNNNNSFDNHSSSMFDDMQFSIKKETECVFLEDDEKKPYLNLSLNYQEVLDAWSDRTLWADESSVFVSANNGYMGEVPVTEEERRRREASVLRYKEKRQTRLFSKKIRYQVRKLNADKRPRLKSRYFDGEAYYYLKNKNSRGRYFGDAFCLFASGFCYIQLRWSRRKDAMQTGRRGLCELFSEVPTNLIDSEFSSSSSVFMAPRIFTTDGLYIHVEIGTLA